MSRRVLRITAVAVIVAEWAAVGVFYAQRYIGQRLEQVVRATVEAALNADAKDLRRQDDRLARDQTIAFIQQRLANTRVFPDRYALFDHCLEAVDAKLDGLYCEFGVFRGQSINYIASRTTHTVHGFDSFEGLPERWRAGYEKGLFALAALPEVRPNVSLHKGWFADSLPIWARAQPGPMAFMHLDADLYSAGKTVFEVLGDRIVPGTVIQFDNYFNYPGWQNGEFKAFEEFVAARRVKFEYLGYCDHNEQAAVRVLSVGGGGR